MGDNYKGKGIDWVCESCGLTLRLPVKQLALEGYEEPRSSTCVMCRIKKLAKEKTSAETKKS